MNTQYTQQCVSVSVWQTLTQRTLGCSRVHDKYFEHKLYTRLVFILFIYFFFGRSSCLC